jgi:hypothetical protein
MSVTIFFNKCNYTKSGGNGTEWDMFVIYASDINLLGENINTIMKNTKDLLDANKEVGLKVNSNTAKYMYTSCHQIAG